MALLFWSFYVELTIKTLAGVYLVRCKMLYIILAPWLWFTRCCILDYFFLSFSFFYTAFLSWMIWLFTYLQSVMCPPWPIWHDWPSVFSLTTCWPHVTRRSASTNQSPSWRAGDQWEAGWWHATRLARTWHITFPLPVSSLRGMWRVRHGDTSSTSDNRKAIQIRKQNTTNLDLASITYWHHSFSFRKRSEHNFHILSLLTKHLIVVSGQAADTIQLCRDPNVKQLIHFSRSFLTPNPGHFHLITPIIPSRG